MSQITYIGSNLPLEYYDCKYFYIADINNLEYMKNKLNMKYCYILGEHTGLGLSLDIPEDKEDILSKKALKDFMEMFITEDVEICLYTCWVGDESLDIKRTIQIYTDDLVNKEFSLEDLVKASIKIRTKI